MEVHTLFTLSGTVRQDTIHDFIQLSYILKNCWWWYCININLEIKQKRKKPLLRLKVGGKGFKSWWNWPLGTWQFWSMNPLKLEQSNIHFWYLFEREQIRGSHGYIFETRVVHFALNCMIIWRGWEESVTQKLYSDFWEGIVGDGQGLQWLNFLIVIDTILQYCKNWCW